MGHRVPKEFSKMVDEVLRASGVEDWRVEKGRRHPMLVFTVSGREVKYFLPSSPSDRCTLMNCRADLRRMCRRQSATA